MNVLSWTSAFVLAAWAASPQPLQPRLRPSLLNGDAMVMPPYGLMYPVRDPGPSGGIDLDPGSIVEVRSGTVSFDSDLHARVTAPAGAVFRFRVAEPDGRRGLRLGLLPGSAPVTLKVGEVSLELRKTGQVSVYDGGQVEVDKAGVALAPGSVLRMGESMVVRLAPDGSGFLPGEILRLGLPLARGFEQPTLAALPEAEPPQVRSAAPKAAARPRKPRRALLAKAEPVFEPQDDSVRNALASVPSAPPAVRQLETHPVPPPPEAFPEEGNPLQRHIERDRLLLGATLLVMAVGGAAFWGLKG